MIEFEDIKKEYDQLLNQLSDPELISDWSKFEELTKRKKVLEKIIETEKEIEEIKKRIEENKQILISGEDAELSSLAQVEISQLQERQKLLENEAVNISSEEKNDNSHRAIIIEIRAGAGGDEAALFVSDLFKMYSRYATNQGWKQKTLEAHATELGGYKEIIFEIEGNGVFTKMKNESGVHRVQRTPETEKLGRIHTSTVSVAILPKPKKTEMKIRPDDLKIDVYRSSGPGGQNVNKRETAVRITHLPTGLVVTSQTERNQLKNKENALGILSARLLEKKESEESAKISGNRNAQIGQADRSEKIRTYNFPQDRITDHRIKKNFHGIDSIMEGKMDPIVKSFENN